MPTLTPTPTPTTFAGRTLVLGTAAPSAEFPNGVVFASCFGFDVGSPCLGFDEAAGVFVGSRGVAAVGRPPLPPDVPCMSVLLQ
jgi:hypothetical protein